MYIHTCQDMRRAEQFVIEQGNTDSHALMAAAISSAVELLQNDAEYRDVHRTFPRVVVYAGKGKNAGDAIGIARELGYPEIAVRCAVSLDDMAPESRHQLDLTAAASRVSFLSAPPKPGHCLIIDGLLGSGSRGKLRPEYARLAGEMNDLRNSCTFGSLLSVDIPTGLDADSGTADEYTVHADATLSIGCVKPGMLVDGVENYVGRLLCVPLPGVDLTESPASVADASLLNLLPRRHYDCFKNKAGRVCIIAGCTGFLGAAQMCAEAAQRAGAGLVELFCLPEIYELLAVRVAPEIMVHRVQSWSEVPVHHAQTLLIGPGMGTPPEVHLSDLKELLMQTNCPVVMDADALRLLASGKLPLPRHAILTPHPGEMRALFPQAVSLSRSDAAARFVQQYPCTLLLKGVRSITTDGSSTLYNSTGGPHMANGGQGDVLAGAIAGLSAQGLTCFAAAALGAYLCGRAADIARVRCHYPLSVAATDLLPYLTVRCG